MELTLDQAYQWMQRFGEELHENREQLTRLDAAIGDGDHGINMDRGFQAVRERLETKPAPDLGALFKLVGSTLISKVGGASGPLYGTAFLRMGGALADKASAGGSELATALAAAYEGVSARGKSARGEKTMLDALGPAIDALRAAQEAGDALPEVAEAAAGAAEAGVRATVPMTATKGRASFLGENSVGHQDPGATSTSLLFRTLSDILHT